MDENFRNMIIAFVLSAIILFGWQAFLAPKPPQTPAPAPQQTTQQNTPQPGSPQPSTAPSAQNAPSAQPGSQAPQAGAPTPTAPTGLDRAAAVEASPRVPIQTSELRGSINLKGARIDDLILKQFHVTVDRTSPEVVLLSPSASPAPHQAYYSEHGWVAGGGQTSLKLPGGDTLWKPETAGPLSPGHPVTLVYDNGQGLIFRRKIAIDDHYMFTITQEVENKTGQPVTLYPYGLVTRHGTPKTEGFYILHEGMIGMLGEGGLEEINYSDVLKHPEDYSKFSATGGWLGITDKYWAAVLIPSQKAKYNARFTGSGEGAKAHFQTDYLAPAVTIPAGGSQAVTSRLFAGAKQVNVIDGYQSSLGILNFDRLIDWGWFYFITKPLFFVIDFFYKLVGNFGVSILIVTVLIKLVFFPLANKSYVSMSKMKKLQPEMQRLRERFKDDRVRQQQELMNLYKKEKVNPLSGCLPMVIQIPVFFALYKVLFITIEMRHAPFFGWIQDLSAPDPTNIFTLFGLLPLDLPAALHIGLWPVIMGITMFVQMRLNPAPADAIQQKIFTWMPVFFTYLLANFPAGLVIYWTWNNLLTITQQWFIMSRQGVEVKLIENIGLDKLLNRLSAGGSGKT